MRGSMIPHTMIAHMLLLAAWADMPCRIRFSLLGGAPGVACAAASESSTSYVMSFHARCRPAWPPARVAATMALHRPAWAGGCHSGAAHGAGCVGTGSPRTAAACWPAARGAGTAGERRGAGTPGARTRKQPRSGARREHASRAIAHRRATTSMQASARLVPAAQRACGSACQPSSSAACGRAAAPCRGARRGRAAPAAVCAQGQGRVAGERGQQACGGSLDRRELLSLALAAGLLPAAGARAAAPASVAAPGATPLVRARAQGAGQHCRLPADRPPPACAAG